MKYEKIILTDLINIYEHRIEKNSTLKNLIKIKLNKEKYPKYFEEKIAYDEAIISLINKNFISVKYIPHDNVVDYIILNKNCVGEIMSYLGISDSVSEKKKRLLDTLDLYNDSILVSLKQEINDRIASKKSIKQYLSNDYLDAIKAVHFIENLSSKEYERNLSNLIFNDSKRLKKLEGIINSIYQSNSAFLNHGILSTPGYLYIKGEGIVSINSQLINLKDIGTSIGISLEDLDNINFIKVESVTTIENLTTFYDYKGEGLIIYLGGFPTGSQMLALKKIKEHTNKFYHFGDIDYGGYTILNQLMEELDLPIEAIKMDLKTLKSNIKFAQSYQDEDYSLKLESLLKKPLLTPFFDTIKYLIENKIWLEQESFYNQR